MARRLRLADLLGALSIVTDFGFALAPQDAMRTCVVSTALGRRLGLTDDDLRDAFYVPLLMHVGCISMSHDTAALFGDELRVTAAVARTDLADPTDFARTLIPHLVDGLDAATSARLARDVVEVGPDFGKRYDTGSCEVARSTARRIGLPPSTQRALHEIAEFWNGGSAPQGLARDEIAIAARVTRVAADAVLFDRIGGVPSAVAAVRTRAGGVLDPDVVDVFVTAADELLAEVGPDSDDPRERILDVEPGPVLERDPAEVVAVAAAFGDAADLKSPWFHGHAAATARHAVRAAGLLGLDAAAVHRLEVAALLHDVGRVGISNAIWEKAGPLTRAEWEQVRLHAYHSERVLATSRSLEESARVAGTHHERDDGSGYHRGCRRVDLPVEARILAAADVVTALSSARPHRPALDADAAARELRAEAREGRLDPDAVEAVLADAGDAAAGRRARATRAARPAGLTRREVEVLRLVADGSSNADIAERLVISRRTAEHHVQHVYTKIGASTRVAAAMFALEHDLLER